MVGNTNPRSKMTLDNARWQRVKGPILDLVPKASVQPGTKKSLGSGYWKGRIQQK